MLVKVGFKHLIGLLSSFLLVSCYYYEGHDTEVEKLEYKRLDQRLVPGVKFSIVESEKHLSYESGCLELKFKQWVNFEKSIIDSLKPDSLKRDSKYAYYINLNIYTDSGIIFSSKDRFLKSYPFAGVEEQNFVIQAGEKSAEFSVPFRELKLKAGKQELKVQAEIYKAKFSINEKDSGQAKFQYLEEQPIAYQNYSLHVNAPQLFLARITINNFLIDTMSKDPRSYDAGFIGYPDLFYMVTIGGEKIYKSPVINNVIYYDKPTSTPNFYCTAKDKIWLRIYDQDNLSFDDLISEYYEQIDSYNKDHIQFGTIKDLSLSVELQEHK